MNASLIEKIKKLIVENSVGDSATLAAMYGGSEGGVSLRKNPNMARDSGRDEYVPDTEEAGEAEQQFLARKMFADSIMSKMVKKGGRNGKVERLVFSYRGDEDKRDWQSTQLTYHNDKIDKDINFWLTPQTREFLHRLIGELTAPVETKVGPGKTETAPKISNLEISAREIQSTGGYNMATMKEVYNFLKPEVQTSVIKLFNLVSHLDSRFRPSAYEIKLTAPLAKPYDDATLDAISKNVDALSQSAMTNRDNDVEWLNTVRSCINDSKVNVKIDIKRDVTLMPLYDAMNYAPTRANVGALNKLAWTYQKMREMNKTMFSKMVHGLEFDLKRKKTLNLQKGNTTLRDEVADLELRLEKLKQNGMDYVNGNFIYGENEGDILNFGPMALIYKSMQIQGQNAAIAITCDSGPCYLYRHINTGSGSEEQCIKFDSSTQYGETLKNFFEGLTTLPEYLRSYADMESTLGDKMKDLAEYINSEFLNKSDPVKIYCLKMMFCDWVNLEYQMDLPKSVFDSPQAAAGLRSVPMPENISVPGSQKFKKKITRLEQTMGGNRLKTTIDNVLSKGSGSLSFLRNASKFEFNGYKLRDNFVDISLLNDFVINTIKDFYAVLDGSQFNSLKKDNPVTVDDIVLDPTTNEALKKFLSTQTMMKTKSVQFVLKCDRENYDQAMKNLDFCTDMISQLCGRIKQGVWSMSDEEKKRLSSSIDFFNAKKAGSPVNISRLENGMVASIHGAENHTIARSNCIVELNRVNDLGPMVSAYLMTIRSQLTADEKGGKDEQFEPQTMVHTPPDGLNMAKTTRGAGRGARQTYVDELYDYMTTSAENINRVFSESFIEGARSNNSAIVECLAKMFDAAKTLTKLTVLDGVRMLEYANLTDIENVVEPTQSILHTGISADAFGFEIHVSSSPEEGMAVAKKQTLPANLNTGLIVDPYCSTYLKPVVRLVKEALGNVDSKYKKPILITDQDCDIPYIPVHTALYATADETTNELLINLVSSCLVMDNTVKNHEYSYVTKQGIVTNDSPKPDEKERVDTQMIQSDFAYAVLGVSSKKYMIMNAVNSVKGASESARKAYDQIVSAINGNPSILAGRNGVSELMKLPVTTTNDLNETISDKMQAIMKFFMVLYVLTHDMEEDLA